MKNYTKTRVLVPCGRAAISLSKATRIGVLNRITCFAGTFLLAILFGNMASKAQEVIDGSSVTVNNGPWVIPGRLTIGNNGVATLNIRNGGTVTNDAATIGANSGSSGTVNVSGSGVWTNSGYLTVGGSGAAALNIENGGTVTSSGSIIGDWTRLDCKGHCRRKREYVDDWRYRHGYAWRFWDAFSGGWGQCAS